MTLNEYQLLAQQTAKITDNPGDKLLNGCMGLNGEAGECIDLLKKHYFQGHALDRKKLAEELGDVLWYCAELATGLGVTLDEVAERNIAKLRRIKQIDLAMADGEQDPVRRERARELARKAARAGGKGD